MEEKKLYYLGTGTEFVKAQCKEYKTIEGALKAAAKDESLVVWDEDGNIIGSLTDNVPDGNKVGTVDAKTVEEMTGNTPENNAEDGQNGSKDDEQANNHRRMKTPKMGQMECWRTKMTRIRRMMKAIRQQASQRNRSDDSMSPSCAREVSA